MRKKKKKRKDYGFLISHFYRSFSNGIATEKGLTEHDKSQLTDSFQHVTDTADDRLSLARDLQRHNP